MILKLPYQEKKGTIKYIEFDNKQEKKHYIVHRYGATPKEEIIFKVPKNEKNRQLLMNNYYDELKEYINNNKNKYENSKNTILKKNINKKLIMALLLIPIPMIISSIPLLQTHEALGFLGISLDIISVPTLIAGINLTLAEKNNQKKKIFIEKYKELEQNLIKYNNYPTPINEPTIYIGLKKESDQQKQNTLTLEKELVKSPNNLKNAA